MAQMKMPTSMQELTQVTEIAVAAARRKRRCASLRRRSSPITLAYTSSASLSLLCRAMVVHVSTVMLQRRCYTDLPSDTAKSGCLHAEVSGADQESAMKSTYGA